MIWKGFSLFDLFEKWDGAPKTNESQSSQTDSSQSYPNENYSTAQPYSPAQFEHNPIRSKTFVLSVGGSVFFNEKLRAPEIAKFCETINELKKEGFQFVIVVGGGRICRVYQAGIKALGGNNADMDAMGLAVTHANSLFFILAIENAWKELVVDPNVAKNILSLGKTPVCIGAVGAQTSDSVAAILAESMGVDFINLSNVDGIYSADPAKEPNARMYVELTHTKMLSLLKAQSSKPGAHIFVDPHAANILWRSKVKSFFINGNDLENFKNLVRGSNFRGTTVSTGESEELIE